MDNPLDVARRMVLGAETGAATSLLEQLLARHQRSWQNMPPRLCEYDDPPGWEPPTTAWCGECAKGAPSDIFVLGSTLLGLVELIDGTRFARGWRGPVEDRRY